MIPFLLYSQDNLPTLLVGKARPTTALFNEQVGAIHAGLEEDIQRITTAGGIHNL